MKTLENNKIKLINRNSYEYPAEIFIYESYGIQNKGHYKNLVGFIPVSAGAFSPEENFIENFYNKIGKLTARLYETYSSEGDTEIKIETKINYVANI